MKEDKSFQSGLRTNKGMNPLKEVAERGVKLIDNYNASITESEDQKHFFQQQISEHRQNSPNLKKDTVVIKS